MSKDKSIARQSALKGATEIVAALITVGAFEDPTTEAILERVKEFQDAFFADTLSVQAQEAAEAPAQESRSYRPRSSNGPRAGGGDAAAGRAAGGDQVIKFGKYRDNPKTIREIYSESPTYVSNFLTKSREPEIQAAAEAFMASIR